MVGRPREFDTDAALTAAMHVFWAKGYEHTTIDDLLEALRIHRGSMYMAFGDKEALFRQAVERYHQTVTSQTFEILQQPDSPIENLRQLVRLWGQAAASKDRNGCLMCNTVVEMADVASDSRALARRSIQQVRKAIRECLLRARRAGELGEDRDVDELASMLTAVSQGLAVMSRAQVPVKDLTSAVSAAEQLLAA